MIAYPSRPFCAALLAAAGLHMAAAVHVASRGGGWGQGTASGCGMGVRGVTHLASGLLCILQRFGQRLCHLGVTGCVVWV